MKAKLKKINFAGTISVSTYIEFHAESAAAVDAMIDEVVDEFEKQAKNIGAKDKHKVNVRKVYAIRSNL